MECRKCKKEIPDHAIYCCYCGVKQEQEKRKALKRANGTGTVFKLSGRRRKPWAAQKGGVSIGTFETKKAALEALDRLSGRSVNDEYNMTFEEVYDTWSKEYFRKIGDSAQGTYKSAFQFFTPLHKKKFRELRVNDFQGIIDGSDLKPSTMKLYKKLINQMYKWAIVHEVVYTDFAKGAYIQQEDEHEKPIFTDEEIKKIEEDGSDEAKIVCMLLATGLRINELFTLKLEDYHGDYLVGGSKTEAGKGRIVPIRPEGQAHFEYFASLSEGKEYLLSGYKGPHEDRKFRQKKYKPLMEKLGIDEAKTPHSTRHTYISRAVKEHLRPEVLQRVVGHKNYSTTVDTYTHFKAEDIIAETLAVANTLHTNKEVPDKEGP